MNSLAKITLLDPMGCPRESSSDMTSDSSHSFNHEARIARPIENPALPCSPLATVGLRAVPIKRGASKAPQASPYGPRDSMPARGLQLAFMLAFRAHLIATTQLRGVYSLQKNDSQRATNMTFVIHVAVRTMRISMSGRSIPSMCADTLKCRETLRRGPEAIQD
ncbi:hypothetical protein PISMIDRAFT_688459 [Pisolithus microcarpus 441]|uniref:Uncharacterized protein n=1 Tax=Pisolithus microcarpus 441 TaxID=765257 RepID=A0A0C9Z151_9AGAM|nr:hypothetical protein PISMIDRAFT_688459 [Pisolithus microcarpus 441]